MKRYKHGFSLILRVCLAFLFIMLLSQVSAFAGIKRIINNEILEMSNTGKDDSPKTLQLYNKMIAVIIGIDDSVDLL